MDHPREISSGIIALSRRVLEWMRANPGTALTALGFILYGLLRIGYELFYRPFGVAPDEVGFGYGQILSQSATGAVVLIFFQLIVMMCLGVLGKRSYHGAVSWVKRQILRLQTAKAVSKRHGPLWAFLYLCSGPVVLLVFAVGVFWPAVHEARWWVYAFYSPVGLWVLQVFYLQPEERVEEGEPSRRSIRVRLHLGGPGLFFAVLAAILTVVILLIPIRALRQARVALQGEPVVNTFPFPSWGAQPAIVSRGKEAAGDLPVAAGGHCLMYLRQAAGTAVLYDVDSGQTVRIPSGSVTITTARSRSEDVSACRTTLVRDEVLGVSAGTAAQRFRVARPPVVPGSLDVEVEEEAGSARWYAVRNFEESRPSDRHYMLHTETGEMLFGDGQRGRFPASGAKIIARRYRQGRLSS